MTIRIYEIEHGGDQSHAISELQRVGCTDIKVLACDYEGEESMVVQFTAPEGMTKQQLEEETELCL